MLIVLVSKTTRLSWHKLFDLARFGECVTGCNCQMQSDLDFGLCLCGNTLGELRHHKRAPSTVSVSTK